MPKLYSLHDLKAGGFYAPFTSPNDSAAKRAVATAAHMDNTLVSQHPSDFELFSLGTFNEDTGEILTTAPQPIALVSDLVEALLSSLPPSSRLHG